MRAVVLVGGEGTRMRPLTETVPKPLLPFMGRPFLHRVLDHLGEHGVHEVVLSSPYLEETFEPLLRARRGDPRVTWITEAEPLGTAGAIVNAMDAVGEETFLVLNGDVLTDLDLTALVRYHRERRAIATIALAHVDDARPYGLVETAEDGRVLAFREKPRDLVPGDINAGTYVLEARALEGWRPGQALSIELEVFPALIERGDPVYSLLSNAYWLDVGTPERYLQAHFDALDGKVLGGERAGPLVASSAAVSSDAVLGRLVVVGEDARIGSGAEVDRSVLHRGAMVGERARVTGSILGPVSRIEARAAVTKSVLAEGAVVPEGVVVEGAGVPPGQVAAATR